MLCLVGYGSKTFPVIVLSTTSPFLDFLYEKHLLILGYVLNDQAVFRYYNLQNLLPIEQIQNFSPLLSCSSDPSFMRDYFSLKQFFYILQKLKIDLFEFHSVTGAPYREVNSKVATAPKLKVEDKDRVNNSKRIKTVKLNIVKLKASLNKFFSRKSWLSK